MAYIDLRIHPATPRRVVHFIRKHVDMQFADVHAMIRLPIDTDDGLKAECNFAAGPSR